VPFGEKRKGEGQYNERDAKKGRRNTSEEQNEEKKRGGGKRRRGKAAKSYRFERIKGRELLENKERDFNFPTQGKQGRRF